LEYQGNFNFFGPRAFSRPESVFFSPAFVLFAEFNLALEYQGNYYFFGVPRLFLPRVFFFPLF
jgi:hypothetical protein